MRRQGRKSLFFFTYEAANGKFYERPPPMYNQN